CAPALVQGRQASATPRAKMIFGSMEISNVALHTKLSAASSNASAIRPRSAALAMNSFPAYGAQRTTWDGPDRGAEMMVPACWTPPTRQAHRLPTGPRVGGEHVPRAPRGPPAGARQRHNFRAGRS